MSDSHSDSSYLIPTRCCVPVSFSAYPKFSRCSLRCPGRYLEIVQNPVFQEIARNIQRGMKLGTWNVRSLYRAGSLKAAARELGRYKLDVVGAQEVRWDKGVTVREGDYDFFYGKGNDNHPLGNRFFCTP